MEVGWFIGIEQVKHESRYSIKQYGYSHRLVVKDVQPIDEGHITAVAGSDMIYVHIAGTGESTSNMFPMICEFINTGDLRA